MTALARELGLPRSTLSRAVQPAFRLFFTHAYASWEKGSVENCNRLVRRWYPKGIDFSRVSVQAIAANITIVFCIVVPFPSARQFRPRPESSAPPSQKLQVSGFWRKIGLAPGEGVC